MPLTLLHSCLPYIKAIIKSILNQNDIIKSKYYTANLDFPYLLSIMPSCVDGELDK